MRVEEEETKKIFATRKWRARAKKKNTKKMRQRVDTLYVKNCQCEHKYYFEKALSLQDLLTKSYLRNKLSHKA
jgi:hypothetical protein